MIVVAIVLMTTETGRIGCKEPPFRFDCHRRVGCSYPEPCRCVGIADDNLLENSLDLPTDRMGKDNMLGEDEDWLHELSIDMFPEDGCLRVYGVGEGGVTAFTRDGIECLQCCEPTSEERWCGKSARQQIIADE